MPKGLIVFIVVVAAVVLGLTVLRGVPGPTRITGTPSNPATEQLVVWSTVGKNAPAHYVNYGVGNGGYTTACGRHLPGMGGLTQFADIERMEAEKRLACDDCRHALERYMDSINQRPRSQRPTQ